jgi:hypothetical protein
MLKKMFKILCPITKKDGTTFWMRVGTAFPNKDESLNLYLDVLPLEGKLQIRAFDERDLRERPAPQLEVGPATADALPF